MPFKDWAASDVTQQRTWGIWSSCRGHGECIVLPVLKALPTIWYTGLNVYSFCVYIYIYMWMYMQGNILRSVGVLQCHTGPQKSYRKTWDVLVGDASKHWVTSPGTAMQPPPTVSHRSQSGFHQETSKEQMQISGMRISGQRRSRDKWTSNNLPAIGSGIHIARCPNLGVVDVEPDHLDFGYNILLLSANFQVSFVGCFKQNKWDDDTCTLQGINISHLGKRKIIFKMPFLGDMLVSWRVSVQPFGAFGVFWRLRPQRCNGWKGTWHLLSPEGHDGHSWETRD